jgi:hypothetical protein
MASKKVFENKTQSRPKSEKTKKQNKANTTKKTIKTKPNPGLNVNKAKKMQKKENPNQT